MTNPELNRLRNWLIAAKKPLVFTVGISFLGMLVIEVFQLDHWFLPFYYLGQILWYVTLISLLGLVSRHVLMRIYANRNSNSESSSRSSDLL